MNVQIRWMVRSDMDAVVDIESQAFEFPWSEADFLRCLRQRNCIGMVAVDGNHLLGYMVYELHKERLHLLNLAVRPSAQLRGVGSAMINKLIGKLSPQRRRQLVCEVRESNLAAQLFFKALGFRCTDIVRGFYDDTPEDAYVMRYRLAKMVAEKTTLFFNGNRIGDVTSLDGTT